LSRKSKLTIEHLWSVFAEIEARENLVSWQVGSIFIWPLIRASLMREVAEKLGVFEVRPPQEKVADSPASDIAFAPANYAIVPFVRRNSAGLDPFSTYIVDSLVAHGEKPLILGMGPDDVGSGRPQVEQLEREFLSRYRNLAKLAVAPTLRKAHSAKYGRVIAHIESSLAENAERAGATLTSITGPYRAFPRWLLVDFWAQQRGWKKFFKAAGVRKVFIVNAWKRAMISGAQAAGATVVEPMHGAISDIHPYLTWTGQDWVAYQPDELLEWGAYWGEIAALPSATKRKVVGAPAAVVEAIARESELADIDQAHQTNTVFIASQAHATKKITKFLLAAAAAHPTFFFTLKQHPQETPVDFEAVARNAFRKGKLASPRVPSNLLLADPKVNTLEAMARSEFVLGVYTTALFEAFALGCKVGVLAFSGWHHIRALVERGDATLINDLAELDEFLKANSGRDVSGLRERADYYYAKPASEVELWAAIKIAE
jgi:hypothetical protein